MTIEVKYVCLSDKMLDIVKPIEMGPSNLHNTLQL